MSSVPQKAPIAQAARRTQESPQETLAWADALFANPHIGPSEKLVLWQAKRYTQHGRVKDETGFTRINLQIMGERTGLSADTVGDKLRDLAKVGIIERQARKEAGQNGVPIPRIWIRLPSALERPG